MFPLDEVLRSEVSSYSHLSCFCVKCQKQLDASLETNKQQRKENTKTPPKRYFCSVKSFLSPSDLPRPSEGADRVSDSKLPQDLQGKSEMTCSTEMSFLSCI